MYARIGLLILIFGGIQLAGFLGYLGWEWYDCLPAGLTADYVGRSSCIECHEAEYRKWKGSYHDLAMDHATSETVLGDFGDPSAADPAAGEVVFEGHGVRARFFRNDEKYFVQTQGREGKLGTFEVQFVFGVDPMQQYLIEMPTGIPDSDEKSPSPNSNEKPKDFVGRLQALHIAWDVHTKKWFYLPDDEHIDPSEPIYWTNRGMNWNFMCADCHSTNLQKNYDPETDTYHTTWTDIDVSCEACHGPGSIHVQVVANKKYFLGDRRYGTGLARLKSENSQVQIDACGQCHARRRIVRPGYRAGEDFLDFFYPELLDTPAYHADGQILEEDYVYSSFHLSLMYHKGIRCTDCHDPHTTRILAEGNALCIRCHIAGKYDVPSHHHHLVGSKGSLCVECHMPETTYMKIDPRRDHGFRIPRPDLTISLGIPNACNRCHDDRTAEWSADFTKQWFGEQEWERRIDFAATIAAGRQAKPQAEKELKRLARDRNVPALLRASAISLLRNYPADRNLGIFEAALEDESPMVRTIAVQNLGEWLGSSSFSFLDWQRMPRSSQERFEKIAEFLTDPNASVRAEAARILTAVPRSILTDAQAKALDETTETYLSTMKYLSDDPGGNLNLGNWYAGRRENEEAETWYKRAISRDSSFNLARFELAMLYARAGRREDAIATFREALQWCEKIGQWDPDNPDLASQITERQAQAHYSIGLLMAEDLQSNEQKTIFHLKKAVVLQPSRHRAHYNLGLAYQHAKRWQEAEESLLAAYEGAPLQEDYVYALAIFYLQRNRRESASKLLQNHLKDHPYHRRAAGLFFQQFGDDGRSN